MSTKEHDQDFIIRPAREQDAPTITRFNIAMAKETESRDLDLETVSAGVRNVFEHSPYYGFYLVTEEKKSGEVVGSLMITFEWSDWNNSKYWYIQSLYVKKEYRRRGIFKSMYAYLKQIANEQKIASIRLYVDKENTKAQATYESLGMHSHYTMYEYDVQSGNSSQ